MAQVKLPKIIKDFLIYLTTITGKSQRTRKEYEYDLILTFRFLKAVQEDIPVDQINTIDISDITIDWIKELSLEDLYLFMEFCEVQRKNSAAARARKVATLRAFFKYLKGKRRLIDDNIAEELETPKIGKRKPVYLNMEEAQVFITSIEERHYSKRDYCMMMFFLNLGIRVSELCSLNVNSIQGRNVTVIGNATDHVRIPIGEGVCGAAAASGVTEIVADVSADSRYLACFPSTRSEIVVPVIYEGTVVAEIDVDSDVPAAFGEADRAFLERVAAVISEHCLVGWDTGGMDWDAPENWR